MTMANIVMSFKLPLKQTGVRKLKQKSVSSKFRSLQCASKIPPKTGLIISNPHLKKFH